MSFVRKGADWYVNYCQLNGVTESGLKIVKEVIEGEPARRVRSGSMSRSISARFASRKMGFTIQAESLTLELASIYLKEFDSSVFGYWDQPAYRPDLSYRSGGRKVRVPVTMDFFVVSEGFIGFEECKPLEVLDRLAKKTPERYFFDALENEYQIPPLAKNLEGTGLGYRVVHERHVDHGKVENLINLYDLLDEPVTPMDRRRWLAARECLKDKGGQTIREIECVISGLDRLSILAAIAHGEFYVDLSSQCLAEPERVMVYAAVEDVKDENVASKKIDIPSEILQGTPKDMEEAVRRFKLLGQIDEGIAISEVATHGEVSLRTVQRWREAFRSGGIAGLLPKHRRKGNSGSKLPRVIEECIAEVVGQYYLDNQARRPMHVYQLLKAKCIEIGEVPPSRQAFYSRLESLPDYKVLKVREGAKRACQAKGYEGVESGAENPFRDAVRFLERCHFDHTQVDIQLVSLEGARLGKPWLTLVVDEFTGFVLGVYLSFRNPNVASLMSVIRLMVKQHGVFPEMVAVDGGKEFGSVYFETLMARNRCTIISREGSPRAGWSVERMFGVNNTIFLDNLKGNNKLAKNIRQVSASHNPVSLAEWEPLAFYSALLSFVDDWNSKSSKSGGLSPAALRDKSIERFGLREKRKVKFDQKFLQDVLPAPRRSRPTLKRNQKLQINRVDYWHACLRSIPKKGAVVDVRYDPFDLNYIYVYYQNEWLKFKSSKPKHRIFDDLESAVIAEVARQSLVVNEAAKSQGRMEIAVNIEGMSEKSSERKLPDESSGSDDELIEGDFDKSLDDSFGDIWQMEIPDAVEVE